MYRTTVLTLLLIPLITLPAMAQLGKVWTDFQAYSQDFQDYLKLHAQETLNPNESPAQTAIYSANGQLNIPDPIAAANIVDNQTLLNYLTSGKFESNGALRSLLVNHEINRLITQGAISSVMGNNGQTRLKEKLTEAEQDINNIDTINNNTNNLFQSLTSQVVNSASTAAQIAAVPGLGSAFNSLTNVGLQGIQIQDIQSKLMSESLGQTIQGNQLLAYSGLNLANISQQMDEANRSRRVDTSAEAARLLRTTSQIDLFGRKPIN